MKGNYSDPTANAAVGQLEREYRRMQKEAARLRVLRLSGNLTAEEEQRARKRFIGIYRPMLEKALNGE